MGKPTSIRNRLAGLRDILSESHGGDTEQAHAGIATITGVIACTGCKEEYEFSLSAPQKMTDYADSDTAYSKTPIKDSDKVEMLADLGGTEGKCKCGRTWQLMFVIAAVCEKEPVPEMPTVSTVAVAE